MESLAKVRKIVLGIVGLPGRGKVYSLLYNFHYEKTFIARKIARYLNWQGMNCQVFTISEYRRKLCGTKECTAEFFDPSNVFKTEEGAKAREKCYRAAYEDLANFMNSNGDVGIFDGTNLTAKNRRWVRQELTKRLENITFIWIESICNDEEIIDRVIERSVGSGNPDYDGIETEEAIKDFKARISNLSKSYQEVSKEADGEEQDTPFIKLYNFSKKIVMSNITGYLESKIVSYLMNLHLAQRPIYFSRHGESQYNPEDRIGGDPDLTEKGYAYARRLNEFFQEELKKGKITSKPKFFTSTLQRAMITSNHLKIGVQPLHLKILDEINAGLCDGLTYKEVDELYPMDANERKIDKLRYRYPRGESYLDLIQRVEPIIFEIERSQEPVIVVAHQAVVRCLYAYFSKNEIKDVPFISVPLNTVICLRPETYFCHEFRYTIDINTGGISEREDPKPLYVEDYRKVNT